MMYCKLLLPHRHPEFLPPECTPRWPPETAAAATETPLGVKRHWLTPTRESTPCFRGLYSQLYCAGLNQAVR